MFPCSKNIGDSVKLFLIVIGKILSALQLIAGIVLLVAISSLQLLPTEYLIVAGCVFVALSGLVMFLTWSGRGKVRMAVGIILSALLIFTCSCGTVYVQKTRNAFDSISSGNEIVHIGIYVRKDCFEEYSISAKDYHYGFLKDMDKENTNAVVQQMTDFFGAAPSLQPCATLPALIDSLLNAEVDAIILNQAYLDILQEMDGYKDILEHICEVELKRIEIKPEPTLPKEEEPTSDSTKPFGIYISGIDARGSVSVRSRSDVNILAVVNPKTHQVLLISTPRDYYIPLSISNGIPDKLTHAGIYGINVSKDTLSMLYGVEMDYYFRINFSGFEKLINALGGITVHSDYTFKADKGRYQIYKGENVMDGRTALAFCRERYALSGGDRARGKHQMAVIQGVIKKALSPALLKNYNSVLNAVEGCFETSIPLELLGNLITQQLKDGKDWNIVTYSVNGTGDYQIPYSMSMKAYVMQPDYATVENAKVLIQKVYDGEILENIKTN